MIKKIFLVASPDQGFCGAYDNMVVCAENKEEAIQFVIDLAGEAEWGRIEDTKVKFLGNAEDNIEVGIILASYNN